MKWSKQQKVASGVLALAAVAFCVDRMFLSDSTDTAEAGTNAGGAAPRSTALITRTPASAAATSAATVAGARLQPAALLAQRLEQVAGPRGFSEVSDAFRPPTEWFPPPKPVTPKAEAASRIDLAEQFRSKHKLIGVMRSGPAGTDQGLAVIGGPRGTLTIRVGQAIEGFVLVGVADTGIRMSDGQQELRLELAKPGLAAAANAQ